MFEFENTDKIISFKDDVGGRVFEVVVLGGTTKERTNEEG